MAKSSPKRYVFCMTMVTDVDIGTLKVFEGRVLRSPRRDEVAGVGRSP